MTQLIITTSTAACSVALIADGKVVANDHQVLGRGHAERLVPMIEALLEGRQPTSILVDCGPGSFTGLRVGLACARALGLAWSVPVNGFSAMPLLAAGYLAATNSAHDTEIAVALTGGHGELFVQSFKGLAAVSAVESLRPDAAATTVHAEHILGNGAQALVSARGHGVAHEIWPNAADAVLLPDDAKQLPLIPLYIRAPDAALPA